MIVKCLVCGKTMIADSKHRGFQVCGCKNETMVDWCDEYLYRLGGKDLSKIEVDGQNALGNIPKENRKLLSRGHRHPKLRWLGKKTLHLIITFILGVALATVFHLIVTNHQVRKTAEAVCDNFGRDAQECRDNIDNIFDMADTEVENNININGGE